MSRIMNVERGDLTAMRELLNAPEFPERWRKQLRRRLGESV
ncbi:3-alpha domain-containing protein [Kocuria atrinae]|nr:3-alpha domain-containing protein [Kocuria atrinae]